MGIRYLVGLASDVPDVTDELADKEEVAFCSQGPGGSGVGLGDGAGEGLVSMKMMSFRPSMEC